MGSRLLLVSVLVLFAPRWIEWSFYGEGGQMQHLVPASCDVASGRVPFGGVGGAVEIHSSSSDDDWQHRVSFTASADVRIGTLHDQGVRRKITLGRATALVGWDSRYVGLRGGLYLGNVGTEEEGVVLPALSIRGGSSEGFVRVSFLDQPLCFPADCVFGIEIGADRFSIGASVGATTGRLFGTGRFRDLIGPLDLHVGAFYSPDPQNADGQGAVLYVGIGDRL